MWITLLFIFSSLAFAISKEDYRIGDEWGKKEVTQKVLNSESPVFKSMALSTASFAHGTAFYLGKFAGSHILATNHHVCPKENVCKGERASFPMLKKKYKAKKLLVTIPQIELALLVLDIPMSEENTLVGRNFSFHEDIYLSQQILTMGFGTAENPKLKLMANQDSDCKVFSETEDYKLMADPDQWEKASYKAWSFAFGCDVSHGDSGSAVVDRNTGSILGLLWTGKFPKNRNIRKSSYLAQMDPTSNEVWASLSYAVPARKIGEVLSSELESGKVSQETKTILKAILSDR